MLNGSQPFAMTLAEGTPLIAGNGYEGIQMCLAGWKGGVARALVKHMFSFAMQSLIIDNSLPSIPPPAWGFPSPLPNMYVYVCVCCTNPALCDRCVIARLFKHFSQ